MKDDWRARLKQAVRESGLGMTTISVRAGLNRSYLRRLLDEERDQTPNLAALAAVCDVLGTSVSWIADGVPVTRDVDRVLRAWANLSPASRAAALHMMEAAGQRGPAADSSRLPAPAREAADPGAGLGDGRGDTDT